MTWRPGENAIRLAAIVCGLALLAFWRLEIAWLIPVAVLIGIVCTISDARRLRRDLPGIDVVRRHPESVPRGRPFTVKWVVKSRSTSPVRGELRDELPVTTRPRYVSWPLVDGRWPIAIGHQPSGNGQHIVFEYDQTVTMPERGAYELGPAWIRLRGPSGFLDGQARVGVVTRVRVLPETFASPEHFEKDSGAQIRLLDQPTLTRLHGAGTEFESLKEYRQGDDPRRIDWRATARMRRPIVRRFQVERHRDVMILIDCGRLMGSQTPRGTKLDCAVDSALMLGRIALQGGDRCGFALFDHSLRGYLPPVSGLPTLPALVNAVYDARVDWGESDFAELFATLQRRQSKRSLIVIISDVLDESTSDQFRGSLRRLAQRHVVLFAALKTPALREAFQRPVEDLEEAARHAVSYRLLHERDEAIQSLRHAGVHIVDIEPQQLTVPLINEFIRIRRTNLL
jgi:uncharacterized protein (DUF58 family)